MRKKADIPILITIESDDFWQQMRTIIREELKSNIQLYLKQTTKETNAFRVKPLYDMDSVRTLFGDVSRTTIYEWIKCGKLKPRKLKGRVYFLWTDIEKILNE